MLEKLLGGVCGTGPLRHDNVSSLWSLTPPDLLWFGNGMTNWGESIMSPGRATLLAFLGRASTAHTRGLALWLSLLCKASKLLSKSKLTLWIPPEASQLVTSGSCVATMQQ